MMKVAVIFGPPGAGKGTQCALLNERLSVKHVSTGNLLRDEVAADSEVGQKVKDVLARGDLVGDDLLFSCLLSYLGRVDLNGSGWLLLDGVPRNLSQIEGLEGILKEKNLSVSLVVSLEAKTEELVSRFSKRWTCGVCGYVGAFDSESGAKTTPCPKCKEVGKFARRDDDKPESVKHRMGVYDEVTAPVKEVYARRGVVHEINAIRSVEEVYKDIERFFG